MKKKSVTTKPKKAESPKAATKSAARPAAARAKSAARAPAEKPAVAAAAKKPTSSPLDLGRMKQLLARAAAETKDLEGQRTRLSTVAATTERAFAEEAQRRAGLEKRLQELSSRKDELEAQLAALKLK